MLEEKQCPHHFEGIERLKGTADFQIVHCIKCGTYGIVTVQDENTPVEHLFWPDDPLIDRFLYNRICNFLLEAGYSVDGGLLA